MKMTDLITLAENKLMALNVEMATAVQHGDVDDITRIETQIAETQATLDTLRDVA